MTNPQIGRHPLSPIAALLLTIAAVFGPGAPAAHAAVSNITCQGTSPITYTPGLTFQTRQVTYQETDDFSTCLSTDPTLTSGISTTTYSVQGSCNGLPQVLTDPSYTVNWNNGQSSVFSLTYTDTIVAGTEQVAGIGTVTAGELPGATGTFIWIYPILNPLQCLTSQGVTSQNGTLTATIIGT